jgi:DNA-binding MarR family transcriptional regulator
VTPGHLGRRRRLIPVSALSLHPQVETSNIFLETEGYGRRRAGIYLTSHARVLLCIAHEPGVRLRAIAASPGITERSAYGIVTELTAVGYVVKQDGRRNRSQIQAHLPLPETTSQQPAIGEVLALLAGTSARLPVTRTRPA